MNLLLVESPGKKKTITGILSKLFPDQKWIVDASVGHIRDLPNHGMADGEFVCGVGADYKLRYEFTERGQEIFNKLHALTQRANHVYLATDLDREGEAISWHLWETLLDLKDGSYTRLTFPEINEEGISEGFKEPRLIDMKRVAAQEARRGVDRIIGYLVTSELRRQTGEKLTGGRCQTPATIIVVDRELQIHNFKPTTHYSAQLNFVTPEGLEWSAEWMNEPNFVNEENPYILDPNFVKPLTKISSLQVKSFKEETRYRNPPAPFMTITLQQAGANALGWSPTKTMAVAQKLYEQGKITYMRSDNPNVAASDFPDIQAVLVAKGIEPAASHRKFKSSGDSQEAHPGVVASYWDLEEAGEDEEERALYRLIRMRGLASQAAPAVYKVRELILQQPGETLNGHPILFWASGRLLIDAGFMKLQSGDDADDDGEDDVVNPLPAFSMGETVKPINGELLTSTTKAPKRFTEASLLKELERNGIGRPATYAAIVSSVIDKDYVAPSKTKGKGKTAFLEPTPLGIKLYSVVRNKFKFTELGYTRDLERCLDKIADGSLTSEQVMRMVHLQVAAEINQCVKTIPAYVKPAVVHNCELCEKALRRITKGAHGPFWVCTGFIAKGEGCQNTLPDDAGKPGKKKAPAPVSEHKCGQCQSPLYRNTKPGKNGYDFWGCSAYKTTNCNQSYPNIKGKNIPDFARGRSK